MSLESPAIITFDKVKERFELARKKIIVRRPQLRDFVGIYPEMEVADDENFVDLKKRSEVEGKEEDIYAEYCLIELIDSKELFENDSVFVCPGSEFDDRKSGADLVITFYEDNGTVFHFSIDVKAGLTAESKNVADAVYTVTDKLRAGQMPTAKYHHYPNTAAGRHFVRTKKIIQLPNLIIHVEPSALVQYMAALSKSKEARTVEEKRKVDFFKLETYRRMEAICLKFIDVIQERLTEGGRIIESNLRTALLFYEKLLKKIQQYQSEYKLAVGGTGKRKLVRTIERERKTEGV
jgi:hypothetical protein